MIYTCLHSFLDSFPIEAITEYWVEFPVLYSMSLLVIYFIFSSVYYVIPNLPIYPSSVINMFVFYICDSISDL